MRHSCLCTHLHYKCTCDLTISMLLIYLAYYFDMVVCTTRHWRTSGQLGQELDICTLPIRKTRNA